MAEADEIIRGRLDRFASVGTKALLTKADA
jgi:hypothetical protein